MSEKPLLSVTRNTDFNPKYILNVYSKEVLDIFLFFREINRIFDDKSDLVLVFFYLFSEML